MTEESAREYFEKSVAYKQRVYNERAASSIRIANSNKEMLIQIPKSYLNTDQVQIYPLTKNIVPEPQIVTAPRDKHISSRIIKKRNASSEDITMFTKFTSMVPNIQTSTLQGQPRNQGFTKTKPKDSNSGHSICRKNSLVLYTQASDDLKHGANHINRHKDNTISSLPQPHSPTIIRQQRRAFVYRDAIDVDNELEKQDCEGFLTNFIGLKHARSEVKEDQLLPLDSRTVSPLPLNTMIPNSNPSTSMPETVQGESQTRLSLVNKFYIKSGLGDSKHRRGKSDQLAKPKNRHKSVASSGEVSMRLDPMISTVYHPRGRAGSADIIEVPSSHTDVKAALRKTFKGTFSRDKIFNRTLEKQLAKEVTIIHQATLVCH